MSHRVQESEGLLSGWLSRQRYRAVAAAVPVGASVLDLGCGQGELVRWLPANCRYYGIDAVALWPRQWSSCCPADLAAPLPAALPATVEVVTALAVIEHLAQPARIFAIASQRLVKGGLLILTTPHPAVRPWHDWGAQLGLFSREASQEHQTFFDLAAVAELSRSFPLRLVTGRRFLWGANQLAIFRRQ